MQRDRVPGTLRRRRLGHAELGDSPRDEHRETETGRAVEREEQMEVAAREVATQHASEGDPEVERPVVEAVGAAALVGFDEVGDQRAHRWSVEVDRQPRRERGEADHKDATCADEEPVRGGGGDHSRDERAASSDAIGEEPADRLGDERPCPEARQHEPDRRRAQMDRSGEVDRQERLDEVADPVDEGPRPDEPERPWKAGRPGAGS